MDSTTAFIGWGSAAILLATLLMQIVTQWRDRTSKGVSPWLFVGQLAASLGFVAYSFRTDNMVFVATNSVLACVALLGQYTYFRNRRSR